MKAETGKYLGETVLKGENRDNSLPPTGIGASSADSVQCVTKELNTSYRNREIGNHNSGFLKPMEYDVQRKIEY
jgi:hypothetical protein